MFGPSFQHKLVSMAGLGGKGKIRVFRELAAPEGVELSELRQVVVVDSGGGIEPCHAVGPEVDGGPRIVLQLAILFPNAKTRLEGGGNYRRKFLGHVERSPPVLIPNYMGSVCVSIVPEIAELGKVGAGGLRDRGVEPVKAVEALGDGEPDVGGPIPHDSVTGEV